MKKLVFMAMLAMLMTSLVACQNASGAVIGGADDPTGIIVNETTPTPKATPTATPTASPAPKDKETEFEFDVEYKENSLYALKYLGFELEDIGYDTEHVSLPGDEYYLVIPRYEGMQINIYENSLADTEEYKEEKSLVYSSNNAKPIVVEGNVSDIFANITVELIYEDEKTEFSPHISCKDGSVSTTDEKGIILN